MHDCGETVKLARASPGSDTLYQSLPELRSSERVILKPKNDEEIEADNVVRRDYVCKNEFFCFLLNFSILVVVFVCFLCLPE